MSACPWWCKDKTVWTRIDSEQGLSVFTPHGTFRDISKLVSDELLPIMKLTDCFVAVNTRERLLVEVSCGDSTKWIRVRDPSRHDSWLKSIAISVRHNSKMNKKVTHD